MKHTPTPWEHIHISRGIDIIRGDLNQENAPVVADLKSESDAIRIVACVNAMEGIENPELFMAIQAAEIKRLNEMVELMRRTIEKDNLHRF